MRNKLKLLLAGTLALSCAAAACAQNNKGQMPEKKVAAPTMKSPPPEKKMASIYDFTMKDIDGKDVKLSDYRGKTLLIVNVASRCGYTPQYEGLERVYEKYKGKGLVILGFPANNFGSQEPGSNQEIKTFCSTTYGVSFPMFAKISVKGADKHPFYAYLTDKETDPQFAGEIGWNFAKFVVNKEGQIVARFASSDEPESEKVKNAIEQNLGGK